MVKINNYFCVFFRPTVLSWVTYDPADVWVLIHQIILLMNTTYIHEHDFLPTMCVYVHAVFVHSIITS